MMYSGAYDGSRFTPLDQINRTNVQRLALQWVFQTGVRGRHETTPLVIDGVMYLTTPQNHAYAIDVRTGRPLWHYQRTLPKEMSLCCGPQNRGFAALGDRAVHGHARRALVALDAKTGRVRWDVAAADADKGYSFTGAPLVVKDKVIVGVAGGEYGIRGFIDAYDAETGKRAWRFYTIPGAGRAGQRHLEGRLVEARRRADLGHRLLRSRAEPALLGHRQPRTADVRREPARATTCTRIRCVALDPDTGTLKWHFQFTPHDVHDWDSTHTPILFDDTIAGQPRKLVVVANRNGFFYVLDRVTGAFLLGKPYTQVTWAKEIDANGRPVVLPEHRSDRRRQSRLPERHRRHQLALAVLQSAHAPRLLLQLRAVRHVHVGREARAAVSSGPAVHRQRVLRAARRTTETRRARRRSEDRQRCSGSSSEYADAWAGVFSTAGGLVFSGDGQGNFIALDAETGQGPLAHPARRLDQTAAISFAVDGRQYVAIAAGDALFAFALPKEP